MGIRVQLVLPIESVGPTHLDRAHPYLVVPQIARTADTVPPLGSRCPVAPRVVVIVL